MNYELLAVTSTCEEWKGTQNEIEIIMRDQ